MMICREGAVVPSFFLCDETGILSEPFELRETGRIDKMKVSDTLI